jgi:hypothetical protein
MKKQQIDPIPFCSDAETLLPGNKCEVISELKQKALQLKDESLLQIGFRVFILQVQELQDKRIPNVIVRIEAAGRG